MAWTILINIAISLALSLISAAIAPRQKNRPPEAAGVDDLDLPTADEGQPVPVVFGTVLVRGPNVIAAGDFKSEAITR